MTDPRDLRIAELEAENATLKARVVDLEQKVADQTQLVLTLKEQLDRNSGNSNKPPSSDSSGQRAECRGKGTGGKRGGQTGHSGSTRSLVTVFKILANGQAKTLAPLFGQKLGILVSDRATALNFWAMEKRQVCWAHLLRKAVAFSERDGPAAALRRELLEYIGILFDYWDQLRGGKLSREEFRELMARARGPRA